MMAANSLQTSNALPDRPKVVALLGPTAAGKTAAALELGTRFPIEIISIDSALVYRGMDIGTAKPSASEQAQVPHHLIDIIDPVESYSAAAFRSAALKLIPEITARGRIPVLVGGTMLYYKALRDGLDELPQADAAIRQQLDAELAALGSPALHARLALHDPATAARLAPNDSQRIQRALEIFALTGIPMSTLLSQHKTDKPALPFEMLTLSLEPSERSALHARIATRFIAMTGPDATHPGGLLDEVTWLRRQPGIHANLPSVRCVGYRQGWDYLDGLISFTELREQGIAATRQLAKRQLTWCRSTPERIVIDCLASDMQQQVVQEVKKMAKMTPN